MIHSFVLDQRLIIRMLEPLKGVEHGDELFQELVRQIDTPNFLEVVIDLTETFLVDSIFVNTLIKFRNHYPDKCDKVIVLSHNPHVLELLKITKLDKIFRIMTSLDLKQARPQ